jgi:transmembrane sensor
VKERSNNQDDLIIRYLAGELNGEEKVELINWLKANESNKKYFDEFCEVWITSRSTSENHGYNYQSGFWKFRQATEQEISLNPKKDFRRVSRVILKYAAIVLVAAFFSGLLFYNIGLRISVKTDLSETVLSVPLGSKATFRMPDGTVVTLNAGSTLRYDNSFGLEKRAVSLKGEGYFKVAKNPEKPFVVITTHLSILALGTAFNVKAYPDDKTIETTLVEGSVKIEGISEKDGSETRILKPNQKLTFFKEDSTISDDAGKVTVPPIASAPIPSVAVEMPTLVTEDVRVEPVISWKENKWIFEKQSLSQIATELERKFDVKIVFESERLKNIRFTGTIIAEPIDQVLEVMSISAPINFKVRGKVVTLSENRNFEEMNKKLYNKE